MPFHKVKYIYIYIYILVASERGTQNASSGTQNALFQNATSERSQIARVMSKRPQNATSERNFGTQFRNAALPEHKCKKKRCPVGGLGTQGRGMVFGQSPRCAPTKTCLCIGLRNAVGTQSERNQNATIPRYRPNCPEGVKTFQD